MTTKGFAFIAGGMLLVGIFIGMGISGLMGNPGTGGNPLEELGETAGDAQAPAKTPGQQGTGGTAAAPRIDFKKYLSPDGFELRLAKLPVKDSDLAQLKNTAFRRVQVISLIETPVTNAALPYLQGLPLYSVALSKTKITDAGLAHLKSLPLKQIFLAETAITDAGLEHLKGFKLILLDVRNAKVTDKGIAELKSVMPGIQVMQ